MACGAEPLMDACASSLYAEMSKAQGSMNKSFHWMFAICISQLATLLPGCGSKPTEDTPAPSTESTADSEISVHVVDKQGYDQVIAKHLGKVVLVDFWSTSCEPCKKQFPHSVEMSEDLADQGLVVVSVSLDDPDRKELVLKHLRDWNADFDNLISRFGESAESMEAFDISGAIPYYKLYDREGALRPFPETDPYYEQFLPENVEQHVKAVLEEG
jgi:thiol-disulfide isomerase/thioredoxin